MVPVIQIREKELVTDESLLKAYQASGNQDELASLYLRYADLVYGTALKYLKEREVARDAVMNIYQELVTKLRTNEVNNFKSWLYVVIKTHCLMQLRKMNKTVVVEFQSELMQSEDFSHLDDVLTKEKTFRKLEDCIGKLNDDQQRIIQLFYLEEKCYNEIVDLTGRDWNAVRSMIQNGRRNLKKCMESNG